MDNQIEHSIGTLSPRQRQILDLVALRRNSKEIARELGLSPATVDSHVATILTKLGVSTRREAVERLLGATGNVHDRPHHHGGEPLVQPPPWYVRVFRAMRFKIGGPATTPLMRRRNVSMGSALLRFVVDAFYVVLFFIIMSAAAYGIHEIVHFCEARNVDTVVVYMLKAISYILVALDGIGVVSATVILTYRFITTISRIGD